jgi:hypothetical protein
MLARQDGLEPLFHQLLAGPGYRIDAGIQGGCDLAVAPSFARLRGVGLQQNTSLGEQPRGMFARMDQRVEPPALLIAELHHIPLYGNLFRGHEAPPSLRSQRVRDSPRNQ